MRSGLAAVVLSALGVLWLGGCGPPPKPLGAATLPVRGKVVYRGRLVTRGTVTFEPEGAGKEAFGEIGPDGAFVLSTYGKDDGAVAGGHRVSVSNAGKSVPLKFASPAASGVEVEVRGGQTEYTIKLK